MNYPENVERRARIIAEKNARPKQRCPDCGVAVRGFLSWCKACHTKRAEEQRKKSELPVGRHSSPEADELRELLDVPMSALHHTVGGGKRVIRSARGL